MIATTYCIISLSRKDPRFTNETLDGVKSWLLTEKRRGEPYLFHEVKPRYVFRGSRLLFSFEAELFGRANARFNIEDIPLEIQQENERNGEYVYRHSLVLGEPISLLPELVPKSEIERLLKINCDRPFRYLTQTEYNRILRVGGLPPE